MNNEKMEVQTMLKNIIQFLLDEEIRQTENKDHRMAPIGLRLAKEIVEAAFSTEVLTTQAVMEATQNGLAVPEDARSEMEVARVKVLNYVNGCRQAMQRKGNFELHPAKP